ncbi:hypothetical protein BH10PLA1_BH10PLA1_12460 [soil metagenome]
MKHLAGQNVKVDRSNVKRSDGQHRRLADPPIETVYSAN